MLAFSGVDRCGGPCHFFPILSYCCCAEFELIYWIFLFLLLHSVVYGFRLKACACAGAGAGASHMTFDFLVPFYHYFCDFPLYILSLFFWSASARVDFFASRTLISYCHCITHCFTSAAYTRTKYTKRNM